MFEKKLLPFLLGLSIQLRLLNLINCQIPCLNGGVLAIQPAGNIDQICICQKNYIGARCEIRLDSLRIDQKQQYGCELRPCWIGATCENTNNGFVCHCSANTFGTFCEQSSLSMTNPCDSKPCYNGGTCIRQDANSYTCACPASYGGLSCKDSLVGACASNPCLRGGICVPVGNNDYKCSCPDWTLGKNCETIFNPCSKVDCMNNGQCIKKRTLAYECTCASAYTGLLCDQTKALTCQSQSCIYGFCSLNTNGQFACTCNTQGYEGTFCEIEKCSPKCQNGYCDRDSAGNYYCKCNANYQGPSCTDVVCFAGGSMVETKQKGLVEISSLREGDYVKTYDSGLGKWTFSRFITYLHQDQHINAKYISLKTSSFNQTLRISPLHLIAKQQADQIEFVFAKDLVVGDTIIAESGLEKLIAIEEVHGSGAYAPLTESGTIVVDSILASCYANTNWHNAAHLLFTPIIKLSSIFNIENNNVIDTNHHQSHKSGVAKEVSAVELPDSVFWYARFIHKLMPYIPFTSSFVFF